jgi:DNA repair protein RecN (Recombination protein N)
VLCITHLPQIAAYADTHFQIEKHVEKGRTRTTVRRLTAAERVEEIGRMLGGAGVSDAVRASAREMLATRAKGEVKPKGESESRKRRSSRP